LVVKCEKKSVQAFIKNNFYNEILIKQLSLEESIQFKCYLFVEILVLFDYKRQM